MEPRGWLGRVGGMSVYTSVCGVLYLQQTLLERYSLNKLRHCISLVISFEKQTLFSAHSVTSLTGSRDASPGACEPSMLATLAEFLSLTGRLQTCP